MTQPDKPREKAVEILCRVEEGSFADTLLEKARASFDSRDSSFILELVYGILRNRARLDRVLDQFSAQPLSKTDSWTRNILRLGAYQMLFLDKVPVSAAVNTSTQLAKEHGGKSGYVNGLLRNLDRKRSRIGDPEPDDPVKRLSILYSHPAWLVGRWVKRYGPQRTEAILHENNLPAPLCIRTNTLRTTRQQLKSLLEAEGATVAETAYSNAGLQILSSRVRLRSFTAYEKGLFIVQDEAAQLVGLLVAPRPGETVLDAAAAPGGKATHLAELMGNKGTIVALESSPERIKKIAENGERLGASIIKPVLGDATTYHQSAFDRILIDAPCSGLGVLKRHPDGRWNKKENTIREHAGVQRRILENCAELLKQGGALIYATCTTEPEENEDMIDAFLANRSGTFSIDDPRPYLPEPARRLVDDRRFFRTFPEGAGMDGFFGARLIRKK